MKKKAHWKFIEALKDVRSDDHHAIRATYRVTDEIFLVVKLFDPDQPSFWTVKMWHGDYENTKSHWNTTEPYHLKESELRLLLEVLAKFLDTANMIDAAIGTVVRNAAQLWQG